MAHKIISLAESLNPAMQEVALSFATARMTVSAQGGFITRLDLAGAPSLLYFDPEEYADALPGKAHYGAPFLCPPGINAGYDRHGPFRKMNWKIVQQESSLVSLAAETDKMRIVQNFDLLDDRCRLDVALFNKTTEALPCEIGLHYYWRSDPENVDLGDQLLGYPAFDNLQNIKITKIAPEMLDARHGIDLHIRTGKGILRFYDKAQDRTIELEMNSAHPELMTWVLFRRPNDPFYAIEAWSAPQGTVGDPQQHGNYIPRRSQTLFCFGILTRSGNTL